MIVKRMLDYFKILALISMLLISIILELGMTSCSIDTIGNSSISSSTNDTKVYTYYVAKNGSDNNPGTEAQPWLTIRKAASTLVAGDTVYVKSGTYKEQVIPVNSGNADAWIRFKNYPGNTVVIDGTGVNVGTGGLIFIIGKAYISFDGFEVTNSAYVGVQIWGSSDHITLQNLNVNHTQRSGINASYDESASRPITNIMVSNCDLSFTNDSGYWESISFNRVHGFEIRNSKIHDAQRGRDGLRKEGIDCKIYCSNGSIHHNEIYHTVQGIYLDGGPSNISIFNNNLHNNDIAGIMLGAETNDSPMTEINIYNNLIYENTRGFSISLDTFNKTFNFINNTLYNNENSEIYISDKAQYHQECVIRNNILVKNNEKASLIEYDGLTGVTIDHNLFYPASYDTASSQYGSDFIVDRDPLFVNPAGDNFNLQSLSPAIDAGSSIAAPAFDYLGASRPQGQGCDLGAYEYPALASSFSGNY